MAYEHHTTTTDDDTEDNNVSLDMRAEDQQQLLTFLRCRNCNDLATDAVDTLCCHVLLCSNCLISRLGRVCPACHRTCSEVPNQLARRLIGCQAWRCEHCGAASTRSEAADHNRMCTRQLRSCPAVGCLFSGEQDAFLEHVTEKHKSQLLRKLGRLFSGGSGGGAGGGGGGRVDGAGVLSIDAAVAAAVASGGRGANLRRLYTSALTRDPSRSSTTHSGKSYCRGPLNGPPCDCCDGHCGPNNGCNCLDCMRRDLATFRVVPGQQALVNREGVIARVSQETGQFYCGRSNMGHDPATDGFCGPNNGNNCHACKQLDRQARGRYADIVSGWA